MENKQPITSSPRLALKIREAAAALGVSESTIRRLIARGEIRASRKLRHPLIPSSELDRFLQASVS
jgi:excisionase family DNA binding protein